MKLQQYIDYTRLHPTLSPDAVRVMCREAVQYQFYAVCVNGCYVALARQELSGKSTKVVAVVGFPLGASSTAAKAAEAGEYVKQGADEIDMVLPVGLLQAGQYAEVQNDIATVKSRIGEKVLKVILETCYLTDEEKRKACRLAHEAEADFVKTSTGFGTGGASLDDVRLMKEEVGDALKIKASGGIRDAATAKAFIKAGANRIGASAGIRIVKGTPTSFPER